MWLAQTGEDPIPKVFAEGVRGKPLSTERGFPAKALDQFRRYVVIAVEVTI